jgi:glutamine cyclotransferase
MAFIKEPRVPRRKKLSQLSLPLITAFFISVLCLPYFQTLSHTAGAAEGTSVPVFGYEVVNTYPHDINAFTQGLFIRNGTLYEGTGLNGRSSIRKVDLATGKVLEQRELPTAYFGEGIATDGKRIVQLTWRSRKGFVYDLTTFDTIKEFSYPTEGWGIAYDGRSFIMSDGSATLYFLDPWKFKETGRLEIYDDKGPVVRLNELEYVKGEIFANVWGEERVARIDPETGRVKAWIDLSGLLSESDRKNRVDVLNGIAYDEEKGKFYVTGKLWPKLFEIKIVPKK